MKQRVFIVDLESPWRDIREVECEIISGKKFTWAETPRGRRHLLGSSAFFMRKSAEHSQRDRVRSIARKGALQWIAPYRLEMAWRWLAETEHLSRKVRRARVEPQIKGVSP